MPIMLPDQSPRRALFRKLLDVGVSSLPYVGGPLAAIYALTHPPKDEVLEQQWREQITKLVNDVEAALDLMLGRVELSEEAVYVGRWLSDHAETGWDDLFDVDDIVEQFPGSTEEDILEVLGELELEGLVRISHLINSAGRVMLEPRLYETFDPLVFGGVAPRTDAAVIARAVLDTRDSISVRSLVESNGWSARRANPALAIIDGMIGPGRKSCPCGVPYRIWVMTADAAERARMRRFVAEALPPET